MSITEEKIRDLLKTKSNGFLYHRESRDLEFKEQFNFAGLAEYFRDFAALANNIGGYIIFGVSNSPRKLVGLNRSSLDQFERIDPERISRDLLEVFSPDIQWEQQVFLIGRKHFGVFYIYESRQKPIMARKDEGRDQLIKNGDIYFRYAGRTQRIVFAELSYIIEQRLKDANEQWLALMGKIAKTGPANAAILDTERGVIEKSESQILVVDEQLIQKMKFIREGKFRENEGEATLRLVGDVQPISSIEVTRTIQKKLTDLYPFSAKELVEEVKRTMPEAKSNRIYEIVKNNDIKNNAQYSAYNFRRKSAEEEYAKTKKVKSDTPSIYNKAAVSFILKVLKGS